MKRKPVMRLRATLICAATLSASMSLAHAEPSLPQQYLEIYTHINEAEHFEKHGDYQNALKDFIACYTKLAKIHDSDPDWEVVLVGHRMDDCQIKILELENKPGVVPPGAPRPSDALHFASLSPPMGLSYPWKTDIVATTFWIGEKSATASAWNQDWVRSNNGADSPQERNGYATAGHASSFNPFYIALPFNDLAFPDKARRWLPPGWHARMRDGKAVSACKDRWVEIKDQNDDTCYAQWEDVGPLRNDHAEYVFGSERPGPGAEAGISVSPAVRDYITAGGAKSIVSWRFVDAQNVRPGVWLRYDEQAVLYTALHAANAEVGGK